MTPPHDSWRGFGRNSQRLRTEAGRPTLAVPGSARASLATLRLERPVKRLLRCLIHDSGGDAKYDSCERSYEQRPKTAVQGLNSSLGQIWVRFRVESAGTFS